jgi:hypothetical protein
VTWSALAVGFGLAACSAPVIEMTLTLPDVATVSGFDLSCVGAVRVRVVGNKPKDGGAADESTQCFDFDAPFDSFPQLIAALEGKFTFDIPRGGLAGVELTGFSARCGDPSTAFESVFYGGAPSVGDGTVVVPLRTGVSCGSRQSYKVRTIDLAALLASASAPAGASCAPPSDAVKLYAGVIRPRMLGTVAPEAVFEYGADEVDTDDGAGKLQSFRPVDTDPSCVALGYLGATSRAVTCVRPPEQARGLCGDANEVEIAAISVAQAEAEFDRTLMLTYGQPVFGAVWEAGTRTPITGATVELADASQGKVVYVDVSVDAAASPPRVRKMAEVPGATSTTAGGAFVAYIGGVTTNLIVKAANHVTQTVRIASAPDQLATVVVALARQ